MPRECHKYGCRLHPDVISPITPSENGGNQFQGDIFKLDDELDFFGLFGYIKIERSPIGYP